MTNKEIAKEFQFLGKIMELHGENAFKTRSYANAYITLRKIPNQLVDMSEADVAAIPGIGKAIGTKIQELLSTGQMQTLNKYLEITPEGIQQLLRIKGLGPKKVKLVWDQLDIQSPGELLYACNENRLVELKGFGEKTQAQLKQQIEYYFLSKGKLHWATADKIANDLLSSLELSFPNQFVLTGELRRLMPIVNQIEILTDLDLAYPELALEIEDLFYDEETENLIFRDCKVELIYSASESLAIDLLESSSSNDFLIKLGMYDEAETEEDIFENLGIPFVPAELRDDAKILTEELLSGIDDLIEQKHIKGVIHNHSTYSDGVNTVLEMAEACMTKGYKYLVMSDHSKSAFYANGLQIERVLHLRD